jgi:hypothetical protein
MVALNSFSTFIFVEHAHKTRAAAEDEKNGEKRRFNVGEKGRKLSIEIKILKLRRMNDIEFRFSPCKRKINDD